MYLFVDDMLARCMQLFNARLHTIVKVWQLSLFYFLIQYGFIFQESNCIIYSVYLLLKPMFGVELECHFKTFVFASTAGGGVSKCRAMYLSIAKV